MAEGLENCPPYMCAPISGRFAAGADPVKREQILDGAKRVFMKLGFDAASMNDVTREAGVSKGTIYVYFQSKEDLFASLIEREKGRFAEELRDLLARDGSVEDRLLQFGLTYARHVVNSDMIPAMRTVIGVTDRMPGLCTRFFASTPSNAQTVLQEFIERQAEVGALSVDDADLASRQFIDLSTSILFKRRLFGQMTSTPDVNEIDRIVKSGLRVFLAAYGPAGSEAAKASPQ
ncbi:TetR/AcrR family transcriptional regulator [Rhizobium sp. CG5]|uniref:TetR/AcrR family transcriptional regulator n=1 Tax=Rhizobium sp. CG5 TaxID=2726076 RepID=UPI0020335B7E|nr:TetR/AcrR family transcriptional regulator [Rhizobium sp. CG5]MCM2475787.1 TetR/AcrR family transcriptional regulator [Rhizobium sp. CG5]